MKKHPVFFILLATVLAVTAGASLAYYNTKSFGFDEDAVIFLQEEDGITVFDFKIYYDDVNHIYNEAKKYIPDKACTIGPHIVEGFEFTLI